MIFKGNNLKKYLLICEPFILALLTLILLFPLKNLIYGEDMSIFYILRPFTFWANPFNSLSSIGFGYAVVFNPEYIFLDVFSHTLLGLGLSIQAVERVLIIFTVVVSNYGLLFFMRQIHSVTSYREQAFYSLAVLLYWFNPFTISVTYYHFETWFFFQALLPYIFLIILLLYNGKHFKGELFLSLLVVLIFSPGAYGPYATVILLTTGFAIVLFVIRYLRERKLTELIKNVMWISIALVIEIYFSLSFLIFTKLTGNLSLSNLTGGSSSFSQIISLFQSESSTTQIYRVLSLNAFVWLYNGRGIISYPWFHLFPIIAIIGFMIPVLFILEFVNLTKKDAFIYFIVALSIIFLIFSTGDNFPFSGLNSYLLSLGGLFLILTNAYYFSTQIYLLTVSVLLFSYLSNFSYRQFTIKHKWHIMHKSQSDRPVNSQKRNIAIPAIAIVLALVIIFGSLIPVIKDGELMTHGPNEDSFVLPSSFSDLQNFFHKNYSSPDYYVAVLPFSRIGAIDMNISKGSFYDSVNIFQQIIPYPVFDWAVTNETMAIDNFFASGSSTHIASLLEAAHIKYVVINPYANMSEWFMNSAPDGSSINISSIESMLTGAGLAIDQVGRFTVFTVPDVEPVALIYTEPDFLSMNSWYSYFASIEQLNNTNTTASQLLVNSVPIISSNNSVSRKQNIYVTSVNQSEPNIIKANALDLLYGVDKSGNLILLNKTANNTEVSLSPNKIFEENSSSLKNSTSNFKLNNGTLQSSGLPYSYLWVRQPEFPNNTAISGNISFNNVSGNYRWVYFYLNTSMPGGKLIESFSLLTFNGTNYIRSSLFYNNTSIQNRLSWDSVNLPENMNNTVNFKIAVTSDMLNFSVDEANRTFSILVPVNPILLPPGGGINSSLADKINMKTGWFDKYSLGIVSVNNNLSIGNLDIYKFINISEVFSIPSDLIHTEIIAPVSYSISDGFGFQILNSTNTLYPVFFAQYSELIGLGTVSHNVYFNKLNTSNENIFEINALPPNSTIFILLGKYNYMASIIYGAVAIFASLSVLLIISFVMDRRKFSHKVTKMETKQ